MKYLKTLIIFVTIFLLTVAQVRASGFYLSSIGSLDVSGTSYPQYWYTSANPILTGVAPVGATVSVTVDGVADTAIAGSDGTWVYQTVVSEGDHPVTLSTETSGTYSFTLTIGVAPEGIGGLSAPETPVAGVSFPTIALLSLGLLFLSAPLILKYTKVN